MTSPYYIVLTTCPNSDAASQLAQSCVENKLAACANILPKIQSIYRWKGKIEKDNESLLIIKTTQSRLDQLESYILEHHPYDIPEFVAINIESGSKNYLNWITQSVKQ